MKSYCKTKNMQTIKVFSFLLCFIALPVFAENNNTVIEILATAHHESENLTPCASQIFLDALYDHEDEISDTDSESDVRFWAKRTMESPDVLEEIIQCDEIKNVSDDKTIIFTPIIYAFPNKTRTITINYSTQPKVLKQKLILARKPSLPDGNPNPRLMDPNDSAKYINTDPAWYAIMVVQHDSLSPFVGPGKNNTLSMKWINDNIDSLYPHGYLCTSKSAIAFDGDTINKVVREVVDIENDKNDYYVAGDVNLEWVMYAEIALEVATTVATAGIGEGVMIGLKGTRSMKTGMRLAKNMNKFKKSVHVEKYIKTTNQIAKTSEKIEKMEKNITNAKKYESAIKKAENAHNAGKNASEYEKEAEEIFQNAKKIDPDITKDELKNADKFNDDIKNLKKESKELNEALEETLKENKRLLKEKQKALKEARENADSKYVKDYDKKFDELQKLYDLRKNPNKLKKANDIAKNEEITKRIREMEQTLKDLENNSSLGDYGKLHREIHELESVDNYIDAEKQLKNILEYRKTLKSLKNRPQTGNIITKNLNRIKNTGKTLKAANNGAKLMNKAGRLGRAGMSSRSAKISDWLKDQTLKHGARLGRVYRDTGLIYGMITFLGDMYDKTSSTSKEFSNGIEFKPLCLLSADDLEGQDNVVNYGMWLMWEGNSTDPADDDAAYLQAMDFATKFFYQLDEYQDEHGANCNVDIYVVHPIIRLDETNMNEPKGELFYLFMNEIPWSTAEQFGEQVPNVADWERNQKNLTEQDPEYKYHKRNNQTEQITNTARE